MGPTGEPKKRLNPRTQAAIDGLLEIASGNAPYRWTDDGGVKWTIKVEWRTVDGVLTATGIALTNSVNAPITRALLRKVPLAEVLKESLTSSDLFRHIAARQMDPATLTAIRRMVGAPEPFKKRPRGRPSTLTPEFYEHVAALYKIRPGRGAAQRVREQLVGERRGANGQGVGAAIGQFDEPSLNTVYGYITEARERGLLPPKKEKKEKPE